MIRSVRSPRRLPAGNLMIAWAAFVVYGSLVPFDFRFPGWEEVSSQFLGFGQPQTRIRSITDWVTNVAIFVPFGFLALPALARRRTVSALVGGAILTLVGSLALSMGIELAQLFFPPRVSSAFDVIANSLGTVFGMVAWIALGEGTSAAYTAVASLHDGPAPFVRPRRSIVAAALGGYVLLVGGWAGFFTNSWTNWAGGLARARGVLVLPFVQHQDAAIGLAVASTLVAAMVFAPVGAALWFLGVQSTRTLQEKLSFAALSAAGFAVILEIAKLFVLAKRPDTGNVLIAGLAAAVGYLLAPLAAGLYSHPRGSERTLDDAAASTGEAMASVGLLGGRTLALLCVVAAGFLVVTFPVGRVILGLALVGYGVLLVRFPCVWLVVVPGVLPVLDLAPWTGQFFFDEFDALVLVTLAVGLWRAAGRPLVGTRGSGLWLLAGCFAVSLLVSTALGLFPLQRFDANALASYYSHYSALRLAKGFVFAAGLAVLLGSHAAEGRDVQGPLTAGMVIGLAAATISVLWERVAYAGLTDFAKNFRVAGLFSTMHTGGAHIDAFLVTALPFVAVWALRSRRPATWICAAVLFAAGAYSVMVTYSRAAVAGFAVVLLISAVGAVLATVKTRAGFRRTPIVATGVLILAGLITTPVLLGPFMQARFATTAVDMKVRTGHWNDAIRIMDDGWRTAMFGMGVGRYPETYALHSSERDRPAVYHLAMEGANAFLRIGSGMPLYIEQVVQIQPNRDYAVVLKARTSSAAGTLNVLLCARTFFYGTGCQSATFRVTGAVPAWQSLRATINSRGLGENLLQVVKLSLENAGSDVPIDVDDVELVDASGKNLVANGGFEGGHDHWFFSSALTHLPWHIKNLWLQVFFEQGWIGFVLFAALSTAALARLARLAWGGEIFATGLLAGMAGFLAVGTFDSVFDAPRLTLLYFLLVATTGAVAALPSASKNISAPMVAGRRMRVPNRPGAMESGQVLVPVLEWRRTALHGFAVTLILAAVIAVVTRLPFLPYNVRELPNPFHPLAAPLVLATFLVWAFGFPVVIARWLAIANRRGASYPLVVAFHGLLAWAMLHFAVLPESIHDVVGSPVLKWPWETEMIARFVPLFSVISVQLTGGVLIAAVFTGNRIGLAILWWLLAAALLFPIQYWAVVSVAATDNITELIADNASVASCLMLSTYLLLVGMSGSLLAASCNVADGRRVAFALGMVAASLPIGYLCLSTGTEAVIIKDKKIFSALQFLLSTDRSHYAAGTELVIRYAVAHLGLVLGTALAQYVFWQDTWSRRTVATSR